MKKMLRRYILKFTGFFPSALPLYRETLHQFIDDVLLVYDLPNVSSYQHAVATMIMQLGPTVTHKPRRFFADSVKKSMANQTAYNLIMKIREDEKLKQAQEAAE